MEVWETSRPQYSSRSPLYALRPAGVGTCAVERIGSYIVRLALAHCITPRYFTDHYLNLRAFRQGACVAIGGIGQAASQAVARLETLTSLESLSCLSWLLFREIVSNQGLLRRGRAWCPCCYQEQLEAGGPIYDLLTWSTATVRVCSVHKNLLEYRCTVCGYETTSEDLVTIPGHCPDCRRWLGNRRSGAKDDSRPPTDVDWKWELWKAEVIGELVKRGSDLRTPLTREHLRSAFRSVLKGSEVTQKQAADITGMSMATFTYVLAGKRSVNLELLLRVAWAAMTSPFALLTGSAAITALVDPPEVFRVKWAPPLSPARATKRREDILGEARAALQSDPPPSLNQLEKRLGASHWAFCRSVPSEIRAVLAERYRVYKEAEKQARKERIRADVEGAIRDLATRGIFPGHRGVKSLLHSRGLGYNWNEVQAIVRELRPQILPNESGTRERL